ncbi:MULTISPECIES: beta-L-arabinofuranosidase domain-containing protein [Catenuloplanes]|uniref:DUF1680 family protein n=1 Tax=Catenuloplanes niger TaxID=587534 RepID=A0AAE4CU39_9ACTN|nr:beta-L-arabinofuranosidase domain-containing protein [Catenuloplanes niger]MDR7326021.1 DUF1680 family protein [Catenuloplanes niger]
MFPPLSDVDLLDGVHSRTRDRMLHLARVFPVDRVLAVFRANAGLDTRGALPPGTWEDFGHPDEKPWSESDYPGAGAAPTASLLRGHYAGHFLSMLSLAHASTGDPVFRDRAHEVVAGLAEVQAALAATGRYSHPGFLAAYGEWQFSRLEELAPYGEIWAPYYTCHKIMAGLLDAYTLTGSDPALDVVTGMGHWVAGRILAVAPEQRQRMWSLYIAGEFGGMNESLTTLHRITGEPVFLAAAAAFEMDALLDAAAAGRDVLDGMHANQHLPMLVGHLAQYEVTGDRRYLDAVVALFGQVVPGRTFAHGGTGEGELWGPAGHVARGIGRRNAETCATYNLLKIARGLFTHTRDVRYADYAERATLNHIAGSRADVDSDVSPEVLYMYPVDAGAVREYGNAGTCCGGTGLESHVKAQESVWFRDDESLYVLQYVPSRLRWAERGGTVALRTAYPRDGLVALDFDLDGPVDLRLRVPEWVPERRALVDGVLTAAKDGFLRIRRDVRRGDTVTVEFPMPLRLVPAPDDPALVSVELGPTVLLARDDATTTLEVAPAAHRELDCSIGFRALGGDLVSALGLEFEPAWSGGDRRYHMYLRVADPVIAFPGAVTEVPDRHDAHGWSFLTGLWASGGFPTHTSFLESVHRNARRAATAGLLGRDEVITVLAAAAASTVSGAEPRRSEILPSGDLTVTGDLVTWPLSAAIGAGEPMPAVRIEVAGERAPSGWYTGAPAVSVVTHGAVTSVALTGGVVAGRPLPDGRHVVRAEATDPAGRVVHATREVAVDTTPPSVRARVRALGPHNVEVTLHADDEVSGVDRIRWRTGETFWGVYQEPFTRALHAAPQILEFTATDRAGNTSPVQRVALPAAGT